MEGNDSQWKAMEEMALMHCTSSCSSDKMETSFQETARDRPSEYPTSLVSSLRPILYAFRLFGIYLEVTPRPPSRSRRGAFGVLAITIVIFIILSNIFVMIRLKINPFKVPTLAWVNAMNKLALLIQNSIYALVMLEMAALVNWPSLRKRMQEMRKLVPYPAAFYVKLQRLSVASLIGVIILVTPI